jgi:hypothetical protein
VAFLSERAQATGFGFIDPYLVARRAGCGQRVAILYGGDIFACRHCYQLAYPSAREELAIVQQGVPTSFASAWPGSRAS